MMNAISHRGPDDEGIYMSSQVGLGHRRLSIIDVNAGKQPISNEDGTVWVVYNGEIYNYKELRRKLLSQGHFLKTETDTEVIVHLYEELGEQFITSLRGMFAFAVWDEKTKTLLLARDRVGIKPLYYSITDKFIVFASEIKAILADPSIPREIDLDMINRFLTFYYMPGHRTLLQNIHKLLPGYYLISREGKTEIKQYWDLTFPTTSPACSLEDAIARLNTLLRETVQVHLLSDVPVGFLLSGGIDSTALLSFAAEESNRDISTFTIGFEGEKFADERPYARLAAKQFGTKHYETTITAKDFLDFLPQYVWHMEEPVCEPPAIALYYVSRLAKEHVKVLISGEGGDEAFAGYPNYRNFIWLERIKKVFGPWNSFIGTLMDKAGRLDKRLGKYSSLMTVPLEQYYYSRTSTPFHFLNSHTQEFYSRDFRERIDKNHSAEMLCRCFENVRGQDPLVKMLYLDTKTWLPDDLLIKADKMTMANSVELRVPLLDHEVLEFAAGLPSSFKLRGFSTKHILKKAFSGRVPKEILYRKKTGFPVPYEKWFRTELKNTIYDILLDGRTLQRGYFEKKTIENLIEKSTREGLYVKEVFSLIILELWHRLFIENG